VGDTEDTASILIKILLFSYKSIDDVSVKYTITIKNLIMTN